MKKYLREEQSGFGILLLIDDSVILILSKAELSYDPVCLQAETSWACLVLGQKKLRLLEMAPTTWEPGPCSVEGSEAMPRVGGG